MSDAVITCASTATFKLWLLPNKVKPPIHLLFSSRPQAADPRATVPVLHPPSLNSAGRQLLPPGLKPLNVGQISNVSYRDAAALSWALLSWAVLFRNDGSMPNCCSCYTATSNHRLLLLWP
jgi:hypothetical protein